MRTAGGGCAIWGGGRGGGGGGGGGGEVKTAAADFRAKILAAVEKSVRRDLDPPFIPIGLFGEEAPYDFIAHSRMGSYWNIMSSYVLGSGVFRHDSETATGLLRYMQNRGGRFAGQNRAFPEKSFWMEQA